MTRRRELWASSTPEDRDLRRALRRLIASKTWVSSGPLVVLHAHNVSLYFDQCFKAIKLSGFVLRVVVRMLPTRSIKGSNKSRSGLSCACRWVSRQTKSTLGIRTSWRFEQSTATRRRPDLRYRNISVQYTSAINNQIGSLVNGVLSNDDNSQSR